MCRNITVFELIRMEAMDAGRLTRQLLKCVKQTSAVMNWFLGVIMTGLLVVVV